jgi:hypothetical protein
MLFDPTIEVGASMSESLESIQQAPLSDILRSIGETHQIKDLFAEGGPRKAWHAEHADVLARCDLSEQHVHMFPKVGLRVIAVWKRTVKGPTLADIKASDEMVPLFANALAPVIGSVLGANLRAGGFALVTTPRRRHKQRNFACMVSEALAERLGIPFREDVAIARTKQRIGVDFEPGNIPPERNLIVFDDFVTTGSTLGAMNRLLSPLGKNCIYFVGVDNQ